jgi:L-alanine-DL-glutamate epimerase-like enolase superfamily enzyme
MKIKSIKVDVVKHTLPTSEPIAYGPRGSIVIVRIETDEGIEGIGDAMTHCFYHEAGFAVKTLIEKGLKNLLIGEDPLEIQRLWRKMYLSEMYTRQWGLAINAISAIDTALLDIAGKAWNVPVYKILGGHYHDKIKVYASDLFDFKNPSKTIQLVNNLIERGFTAIKLGYGGFGFNIDESIKMIKDIRDAISYNVTFMVDGPATLSVPQAIKLGKKLEKYEIFFWEEPLPKDDIEGYIQLSKELELNIAAGEQLQTIYAFKDWIVKKAVDIIQPDVHIAGGLSHCRKIADLAEEWNILLIPHSWSTAINFVAALHLVSSIPNGLFVEYRTTPTVLMNELLKEPIKIENGYAKVPDKAGLGIELNEKVIKEYKID